MSFAAELTAIESRFKAAAIIADNLTFYGNVPAKPPDSEASWVVVTVLNGDTERITIGTVEERTAGVIIVQCFGKQGIGDKTLRTLADSVAAAFRGANFSGILCRSPSIRQIPNSGSYRQLNVLIPFQRDEVH